MHERLEAEDCEVERSAEGGDVGGGEEDLGVGGCVGGRCCERGGIM